MRANSGVMHTAAAVLVAHSGRYLHHPFNNLKARYIQPLDFDIWLELNRKTPVASRLYEYLIFVFGRSNFREISYEKLAASIPLTKLKEKSRMKQQLDPALKALTNRGLLKQTKWTTGKYGNPVIEFQRGDLMNRIKSPIAICESDSNDIAVQTNETYNEASPTDRFICDYYQKRFGTEHTVTSKEQNFVRPLIDRHGYEYLNRQLSKLVRRMKQEFPAGASMMASATILNQLLATKTKPKPVKPEVSKDCSTQDRKQRREQLESQWANLTFQQQATIEEAVAFRLGKKSDSPGFRLMALHEADRVFFES